MIRNGIESLYKYLKKKVLLVIEILFLTRINVLSIGSKAIGYLEKFKSQ